MSEQAARASRAFQRIEARAPDADAAERALAETVEAGAMGAEQREEEGGVTLVLYAPQRAAAAVLRAAREVLGAGAVAEPEGVEPVDWSEAWKEGLRAIAISPRLRVRPPFDASAPAPGQRDLVIEPGQAFGTGGHESTRLALAWLDALGPALRGARVLDAGVGSGILALAALALGARTALGFDLDPLAAPAARENARANGLATGLALFTGPLEALRPGARFEGVTANLLRRELEPLLAGLASRIQEGGWFVISGLLADQRDAVVARAGAAGLRLEGARGERDASGAEWLGLLMRRGPPRAAR